MITATAAQNAGNGIAITIGILFAIFMYWLPTIVGAARHVPNIGSVAVIDGLLGWTAGGWVAALAMACRSLPESPYAPQPPAPAGPKGMNGYR